MSELDLWLSENHRLTRGDLTLRLETIVADASRYSKEHTLPEDQKKIDHSAGPVAAFEKFLGPWIEEVERSAEEDEKAEYRAGENIQVASEIAEIKKAFQGLGDEVTLEDFPFRAIPEGAQPFVVRALQKEMSRSLEKLGKVDPAQSALVYIDRDLRRILEMEF